MNSRQIAFLFLLTSIVACKKDEIVQYNEASLDISPRYGLVPYDGSLATDAAMDAIDMADEDTFWEAVGFKSHLVITWNGNSVDIQGSPGIKRTVSGADVMLDIAENKKLEIVLRGSSENGSLKVYGAKKFKLTFSGLDLQSTRGAAINIQCPKRVFAHLTDGTVNRICDASAYMKIEGEDMKGCFFAEGDIIFSGKGVLLVDGHGQNGIVSDDGIVFRPGVTIVSSASADVGKAVKANDCIDMRGGFLSLSTSGNAYYDEAEQDDKSSACMSADSTIFLRGGILTASSTGLAGKGIKTDHDIFIGVDGTEGPAITISTSGARLEGESYSSSPKGIKAMGRIEMRSGTLSIPECSHEGVESKSTEKAAIHICGGRLDLKCQDDCINTAGGVHIEGGNLIVWSTGNDGIDANFHGEGSFVLDGGHVIALTSIVKHDSGVDTDKSPMSINGGTLFTCGRPQRGITSAPNEKTAVQPTLMLQEVDLAEGDDIVVCDASGEEVFTYRMPFAFPQSNSLLTCPAFTPGQTYTVQSSTFNKSLTFNKNYIKL